MTESEKAKAYDKAIEEARNAYKDEDRHLKATLERVFPELAENKDESIRRYLLAHFSRYQAEEIFLDKISMGDIVAWLEKQKPTEKCSHELSDNESGKIRKAIENVIKNGFNQREDCHRFFDDYSKDQMLDWLEKQGEQKFIIPKFRVGDTIHKVGENTIYPMTIERISKTSYICNDERDFVNIEMQDKFELVEQKPAEWSEEDEGMLRDAIDAINATANGLSQVENSYEIIDWLKSLRPQSKQDWSEEDERIKADAIYLIAQFRKCLATDESSIELANTCTNWLKSLRPQKQWKPSDEHIKALEYQIANTGDSWQRNATKEVLGFLKQLKGE